MNDEQKFACECSVCGKEHGNSDLRDLCELTHKLEALYEEFPRAKPIASALKAVTND